VWTTSPTPPAWAPASGPPGERCQWPIQFQPCSIDWLPAAHVPQPAIFQRVSCILGPTCAHCVHHLIVKLNANACPFPISSPPCSFDYILDQQAYVAVDAGTQANPEVIQAFKSHPVHKVGGQRGAAACGSLQQPTATGLAARHACPRCTRRVTATVQCPPFAHLLQALVCPLTRPLTGPGCLRRHAAAGRHLCGR